MQTRPTQEMAFKLGIASLQGGAATSPLLRSPSWTVASPFVETLTGPGWWDCGWRARRRGECWNWRRLHHCDTQKDTKCLRSNPHLWTCSDVTSAMLQISNNFKVWLRAKNGPWCFLWWGEGVKTQKFDFVRFNLSHTNTWTWIKALTCFFPDADSWTL